MIKLKLLGIPVETADRGLLVGLVLGSPLNSEITRTQILTGRRSYKLRDRAELIDCSWFIHKLSQSG